MKRLNWMGHQSFNKMCIRDSMVGALLISDSSVHRLGAALAKLRLPQTVLVPLTVTLRYFPTLKEEASHIRDAMALREIPLRNSCLLYTSRCV